MVTGVGGQRRVIRQRIIGLRRNLLGVRKKTSKGGGENVAARKKGQASTSRTRNLSEKRISLTSLRPIWTGKEGCKKEGSPHWDLIPRKSLKPILA